MRRSVTHFADIGLAIVLGLTALGLQLFAYSTG